MTLKEYYFEPNWAIDEEDLTVSSWKPDAKDPSMLWASATIDPYHGESFSGETIKATANLDLECGSIHVRLQAGDGYDSALEFSAPSDKAMMGMLEVLASFESRGGSQWEWCGVAWLALQLVKSAYDGRTAGSHHPAVAIIDKASDTWRKICVVPTNPKIQQVKAIGDALAALDQALANMEVSA